MTLATLRETIAALALSVAIGGCTTSASTAAAPVGEMVFVIVRHAEKAANDPKDPTLSEAGSARALRVAERLSKAQVSSVYATGYRRAQQTAAPTALAHRLEVRTYDASMPATVFATQLRTAHASGTVLVVGHSNTVPAIAAALCGCDVAPMREDEYDRWIRVHTDRNGTITLEEERY
ncbi:MAG: histidine phosphatase family protein [Xanthomonadales bacterium]|nr:histidine phosphatase family protein [Xanthomonadales bacterium]